jgi:hypothetical protein
MKTFPKKKVKCESSKGKYQGMIIGNVQVLTSSHIEKIPQMVMTGQLSKRFS